MTAMRILFLAVLSAGVSACASGPDVRKDTGVDLAGYHTFRWLSESEARELRLADPVIDGPTSEPVRIITRPALEERLRPLIEARLNAEGFRASNDGNPDFFVTFYGKSKDDDWVSSWSGSTPALVHVPLVVFPHYDSSGARDFREGVVYLVIYDSHTKKPAWTGSIYRRKYPEGAFSAEVDDLVSAFRRSL